MNDSNINIGNIDEESLRIEVPFVKGAVPVQVQSVLYHNEFNAILRAVESLAQAAELAISDGVCSSVKLRYGDSSSFQTISDVQLCALNEVVQGRMQIEYIYFNANLGSARGHNTLAKSTDADFLLIQNPDIVVSPRIFNYLLDPFTAQDVGMTEAKQIPIEHPKDYNVVTGETDWATTACAMIPVPLFKLVNGFDSESFFLYCDDVDFSWLIRQAGYKIIFQPAAVVFHDKRLTTSGKWASSSAEQYYSAEAALILAHKWSRSDLAEEWLAFFENHGDENQRKAAQKYHQLRLNNQLPKPRDPEHKIAQFVGNYFTRHRFIL